MVEENSGVATGQTVNISTSIGETTKHDYAIQGGLQGLDSLLESIFGRSGWISNLKNQQI